MRDIDPDQTLADALEAIQEAEATLEQHVDNWEAVEMMRCACRDLLGLHDWILAGNPLPRAWQQRGDQQ